MKFFKLLAIAQGSLMKNRTRSILTMLGIIIGVGAVIVMRAIGDGAQQNIEDRINSLGTNLLMIRSESNSMGGIRRGAGSSRTLFVTDVEKIREQSSLVMAVSGIVQSSGQVIGGGTNWFTNVQGVDPEFLTIKSWEVEDGTMFTERDIRAKTKVAVLGASVVENMYGGVSPVGQTIRVQKTPFKIIGVLKAKGQSSGGQDQDDTILVPLTTAAFRLRGDSQYVSMIYASATDVSTMEAAQIEITDTLRQAHKLIDGQEDDFTVRSQSELTEAFTSTTQTMTTFLTIVAAVSLIVGGVGIMNIMLVSVTERTREIGIRVAVGARSTDVLIQFLIEAVVLSVMGGAIGIAIAYGVCEVVQEKFNMTTIIKTWIVAVSLGVSAAIGVIFGLYPAFMASRLDPIDALRHE
ncbi:MAG: ABC transporter permease [Verrucomicrobia bacterium]|nr:ABC transporter permease [Verrucomicrobiota bacterium]MDA1067919.1 ABC transporter permease [Verrucomicrobiota bacterium]